MGVDLHEVEMKYPTEAGVATQTRVGGKFLAAILLVLVIAVLSFVAFYYFEFLRGISNSAQKDITSEVTTAEAPAEAAPLTIEEKHAILDSMRGSQDSVLSEEEQVQRLELVSQMEKANSERPALSEEEKMKIIEQMQP